MCKQRRLFGSAIFVQLLTDGGKVAKEFAVCCEESAPASVVRAMNELQPNGRTILEIDACKWRMQSMNRDDFNKYEGERILCPD